MKITTLCLLLGCLHLSATSLSQTITLKAKGQSFAQIFAAIQRQTDFKVIYSDRFIQSKPLVTISAEAMPLEDFLNQLLQPQQLTYEIVENTIMIKYAERKEKFTKLDLQQHIITGTVTDSLGGPLAGVSVLVQGTSRGTATDKDGRYQVDANPGAVLLFRIVGYLAKTVTVTEQSRMDVILSAEAANLDEIIVTGVFDRRSQMNSSIAISTVSSKQIQQQAPVSAADLLKNVPGVFVNSSLGEIRNVVYSRGVSAGSVEAGSGYYYVSLQEDGLPVTNVTFSNFGPDYFYRPDASLRTLEAVRGGTASITGSNAPGGIFNYVSKTGGETFEGEARVKLGLEGDANPYYRADLNLSGPAGKQWYYNVGGFYRYAIGQRDAGYPMNKGGQLKGNLVKKYETGSLKLYAKYLNDHNGWFEFLPVKNFDHPELAQGIKETDAYLLPKGKTTVPFGSPDKLVEFDPTKLAYSREYAGGVDWNQQLGKGWELKNNIKYSYKDIDWNSSAQIYPMSIDNPNFHSLFGTLGINGVYSFRNAATQELLAQVRQSTDANGVQQFQLLNSQLNGSSVQPNGVYTQVGNVQFYDVHEIMDQAMLTKKWEHMSLTGGMFFSRTHVKYEGGRAGMGTRQILPGDNSLLQVTLERESDGATLQVTNPDGYGFLGGVSNHVKYDAVQTQIAGFIGHDWDITPELNLDWGVRFERIAVKGTNYIAGMNPQGNDPNYGGVDGNPLTLYDNRYYVVGSPIPYDKHISTVSVSAGLNYTVSPELALYGRYSRGQKSPDLAFYFGTYSSPFNVDNYKPTAQVIQQVEGGIKWRKSDMNVFVTPFYSLLSNIYSSTTLREADGITYYVTNPLYNSIRTYGVEIEGSYTFLTNFNIRAVATIQNSIAKEWKVQKSSKDGREDDYLEDYSGNKADNTPNLMLNITPSYSKDRLFTFLSWKYMGNRPANVPNTFDLKAFSQFDFALGYNFTQRLMAQVNVNNVANSRGIMSWSAPGGYPTSTDRQAFTPDVLAANPDVTWFAISVQPRSYFLTLAYKF